MTISDIEQDIEIGDEVTCYEIDDTDSPKIGVAFVIALIDKDKNFCWCKNDLINNRFFVVRVNQWEQRKIRCSHCFKQSIFPKIESNYGKIAAMMVSNIGCKGWIPKNSILFSGKNNWYFYCSKECKEIHYEKLIQIFTTPERRQEINQSLKKYLSK